MRIMLRFFGILNLLSLIPLVSVCDAEVLRRSLPEVEITSETLGGSVIMIGMKYSLVINKNVHEALAIELGEKRRNDFFRDMVLEKDPVALETTYGGENHKVTLAVVERYRSLWQEKSSEKLEWNQKKN